MTRAMSASSVRCAVRLAALGLGSLVLFLSDAQPPVIPGHDPGRVGWTSRAEAVIGRPLTPLSYAGAARRTTRRAYGGVYAAPYVAAPVVVAPRAGCVRAVDAYGRVYWRCI